MTVNREKTQQAAERHVRRGNWDKAIGLYLELVHDDPSDLRSKLKLADLYTRVEDMPKAIQTYIEVGQGYERTSEFDKAAAVYKVARSAVPDNLEISEMLGNLFSKMGRNKEALQVLGEVYLGYTANEDGKRAQGVLETMTMLDPDDVGLKIQLAERYKKQQDTRRALNTFHAAADILRQEGRSDELFQVMQRILFLSPESLDVRKEVIKGLLERNEEKKALQHFRSAIEEAPEDLELLNLLGITFERLDSIDNAVEVYERMIGLYGDQTYKPRVQQLQDRILEIAPDSPSAKIIRAEREGRVTGLEEATADEPSFDLLSGDDLFGDRDILDDVEFLDDPFGVIGTESPVQADAVDPNEFTRFSQPVNTPSTEDYDFINSSQGFDPELTTQVSTEAHGLDAPTYVHPGVLPTLDDAPTQEDAEPDNVGRKDVTNLLKRVESFFQFNLFGQADELTRDIITLAPDNFLARDQRRRICENLGHTEEAADQLMEMARIVVDDPRLSSKYLSRAMTLTDNPQRFEEYANQIRSQWEDVAHPLRETSAERRAFSLPKPGNSETEFREPQQNRRVTKSYQQGPDGSIAESDHPLRLEEINVDSTFDELDLADIQEIPVNYVSEDENVDTFFVPNQAGAPKPAPKAKESFDLEFLDAKDKLANIFDDIDIDFDKFGEQSLSSAFMSKDLLQVNPVPEEGGDAASVADQLNSLEVGEVLLQSGRYNDAIETLEPLLNDADDRVKAQLLLADVYIELGDVPKAAEFLFSIINEEVSTPEQRAEAQAKLSKIG